MFWGFSEAINFVEEYEKHIGKDVLSNKNQLNILLYGGGDPRFILKTIANAYKFNKNLSVHFYVCEGCIELVARYMILIAAALENPQRISLRNKVHLFMDILGNALVRPLTYQYIWTKADHLRNVLTDDEIRHRTFPILTFDQLKYIERDQLENAFEFWLNRPQYVFDIRKSWEQRVRADLKTRYDSRNGAFDWDHQMKLKEYGGKTICSQEYQWFRETGIAFTFPEYEQCHPNKTMAVGLVKNGSTMIPRGCVGDITVGPYFEFGVKCVDESMLKQTHGVGQYRATDITERNVYEMLYEIQKQQPYVHDKANIHAYGSARLLDAPLLTTTVSTMADGALEKFDDPIIPVENTHVHFMSVEDVIHIVRKEKFQKFFDVFFVAANYQPFLKEEHMNLMAADALVLFETRQYSTMTKKEIGEFLKKIKEYAKQMNLKAVTNFSLNLPYGIVKYKKE